MAVVGTYLGRRERAVLREIAVGELWNGFEVCGQTKCAQKETDSKLHFTSCWCAVGVLQGD